MPMLPEPRYLTVLWEICEGYNICVISLSLSFFLYSCIYFDYPQRRRKSKSESEQNADGTTSEKVCLIQALPCFALHCPFLFLVFSPLLTLCLIVFIPFLMGTCDAISDGCKERRRRSKKAKGMQWPYCATHARRAWVSFKRTQFAYRPWIPFPLQRIPPNLILTLTYIQIYTHMLTHVCMHTYIYTNIHVHAGERPAKERG